MTTSPDKKIIQIMPATGWWARWKDKAGNYTLTALAAWALVENVDGWRCIEGFTGSDFVDDCEGNGTFVEYVHEEMLSASEKNGSFSFAGISRSGNG